MRHWRIFWRGTLNYLATRPLVVSFEVTHSCNASCRHCDKGGLKPKEDHLAPAELGRICRKLKPALIQLSGGEPLLREDLGEIIREIRSDGGPPYIILVSNAHLLTEEKYVAFRRQGVDQLSISIDYPDERHDEFRRIPGLFGHLSTLLPRLARHQRNDIVLNTAITRGNFRELTNLAALAARWGVRISFSAYSQLRTGDPTHNITEADELALLKREIENLISMSGERGPVTTPPAILRRTHEFFSRGSLEGCPAGERFLVVEPDGTLVPCSLCPEPHSDVRSMQKHFTRKNRCGGCFVSIRAYVDRSYGTILRDSLRTYRRSARGRCLTTPALPSESSDAGADVDSRDERCAEMSRR